MGHSAHYPPLSFTLQALIAKKEPLSALYYIEKGSALPFDPECNFEFQRGRAYVYLEEFDEAICAYQQATKHSEFPTLYSNLGYALSDQKRYKEAYIAFQRAIELDKKHPAAYKGLKQIKEKLWRKTKEEWKKEILLQNQPQKNDTI